MSVIVTWNETGKPPVNLTINDTAAASLESYRLSLTIPSVAQVVDEYGNTSNSYVQTPRYPDVLSMILAALVQNVVMPAFRAFPSEDIQTAAQAAKSAADALAQAESEFIASALTFAPSE